MQFPVKLVKGEASRLATNQADLVRFQFDGFVAVEAPVAVETPAKAVKAAVKS